MASEPTGATELRLRAAALAVLGLLAVQPRLVAQAVYHGCGMAGNAAGARGQALNRLKNRFTAPEPAAMDTAATLAALLSPGDDRDRWSDQRGATVVGYVRDVKPGGFESTPTQRRTRRRDIRTTGGPPPGKYIPSPNSWSSRGPAETKGERARPIGGITGSTEIGD